MATTDIKVSKANREKAIAKNETSYEGKVCKHHPDGNGIRYVVGSQCVLCTKDYNQNKDDKIRNDPVAWCFQKATVRIAVSMHKKGIYKYGSPSALLGCDAKTLYEHLSVCPEIDLLGKEYQIDHIKPLCEFNLYSDKGRKEAFHYTNLQALTPVRHMLKTLKEMGHNVRDPELLAIAKRLGEL